MLTTPPPGPKGEVPGRRNHESWRADMFGFLAALAHQYGNVVGFDLGRSPCILVNGASEVRQLFFEREEWLRKPEFVKDSNRGYWGDGLTTLEGAAWRSRRQAVRPSFTAREVASRLPIIADCAAEMLDRWADGADLRRELRILTARIAARVVLDAEIEGYGAPDVRSGVLPLAEAYGEEYASAPGGDPSAVLIMTRPRAPRCMDATLAIIDERIGSGEPRGDVLSHLVAYRLPDGSRLSRDEIAGELIQMLYAGHLTIPFTLGAFWRELAGTSSGPMVAAEADRLGDDAQSSALSGSYCLAALKESMRLHPAAPILYREVDASFELAGFAFARDTAVWVSPRLLHVDPRYFSEPQRFLPERFMKGGLGPASASAYLPFGAGPRACVGSHMALQQMTLIALMAARRFTPEWISERLDGT